MNNGSLAICGLALIIFINQIDDGRRFTGSGRTVKQDVWKIILVQNIFKNITIDGV
jgi:hypothetical protein